MTGAGQRVILMACGSYNPPQIMHLRMFELARDFLTKHTEVNVIGGILSPVHDGYGKAGLVEAKHRIEMLRLATQGSGWVKTSAWEALCDSWSRTHPVMDYHQSRLNAFASGDLTVKDDWMPDDISNRDNPVRLKLLCGADVLESFNVPGLWEDADVTAMLKDYGFVVITREGNECLKSIYKHDILTKFQANITVIREWVSNDISATKIRTALRRNNSVKYLVPDLVLEYIKRENFTRTDAESRIRYFDERSLPPVKRF